MDTGGPLNGGACGPRAGAVVSLPTEPHSDVSSCRPLTKMAPNASHCDIPGWLLGEGTTPLSPSCVCQRDPHVPGVHVMPSLDIQEHSHSGYLQRGGREERAREGAETTHGGRPAAADWAAIKIHTAVL